MNKEFENIAYRAEVLRERAKKDGNFVFFTDLLQPILKYALDHAISAKESSMVLNEKLVIPMRFHKQALMACSSPLEDSIASNSNLIKLMVSLDEAMEEYHQASKIHESGYVSRMILEDISAYETQVPMSALKQEIRNSFKSLSSKKTKYQAEVKKFNEKAFLLIEKNVTDQLIKKESAIKNSIAAIEVTGVDLLKNLKNFLNDSTHSPGFEKELQQLERVDPIIELYACIFTNQSPEVRPKDFIKIVEYDSYVTNAILRRKHRGLQRESSKLAKP